MQNMNFEKYKKGKLPCDAHKLTPKTSLQSPSNCCHQNNFKKNSNRWLLTKYIRVRRSILFACLSSYW